MPLPPLQDFSCCGSYKTLLPLLLPTLVASQSSNPSGKTFFPLFVHPYPSGFVPHPRMKQTGQARARLKDVFPCFQHKEQREAQFLFKKIWVLCRRTVDLLLQLHQAESLVLSTGLSPLCCCLSCSHCRAKGGNGESSAKKK